MLKGKDGRDAEAFVNTKSLQPLPTCTLKMCEGKITVRVTQTRVSNRYNIISSAFLMIQYYIQRVLDRYNIISSAFLIDTILYPAHSCCMTM